LAHLIGWWGKVLVIRDVYLCWFLSIEFELLELSLKHILPNFAECWWDHIILDILVCNGIGIWLGHRTVRYLEMKEYDWTGRSEADPRRRRSLLMRLALQFTPHSWKKYEWDIFNSPKRFLALVFIIIVINVIELNCFFLKYVLWHPPPHPLVPGRLFVWWLFSMPAMREYYEFVTNPHCKKIGPMAWLCFAMAGVEVLVWVKFSKGQFPHVKGHPPLVIWSWTLVFVVLTAWFIIYFYIYKPKKTREYAKSQQFSQSNTVTPNLNPDKK
jgi:phosphatidylserine synthase 2